MNDCVAKAVETDFPFLANALEYSVGSLLSYVEERRVIKFADREIIEKLPTSRKRLLYLLKMIRYKDNGYDTFLEFLQSDNRQNVVDRILGLPGNRSVSCPSQREFGPKNCAEQYTASVSRSFADALSRGELSEELNEADWRISNAVQSACAIAHWACCECKYEFGLADLKRFGDIADSFNCEYLLYQDQTYVCSSSDRKVEFLNRKNQEFFAALHCFSLISGEFNLVAKDQILRICLADGHVGQFFFCLCSSADRFVDMLDWIRPTFCDIWRLRFPSPDHLLHYVSHGLVECTREENRKFGLRLSGTSGHIAETIERHQGLPNRLEKLHKRLDISNHLRKGLYLRFIEKEETSEERDWFVAAVIPNVANLAKFTLKPPSNICSLIEYIDVLLWTVHDNETLTNYINTLPPTRVMVVRVGLVPDMEVNLRFDWGNIEDRYILEHFSLGFGKIDVGSLELALRKAIRSENTNGMSGHLVGLRTLTTSEKHKVLKGTVFVTNVNAAVSPSQVIFNTLLVAVEAIKCNNNDTSKLSIIPFP